MDILEGDEGSNKVGLSAARVLACPRAGGNAAFALTLVSAAEPWVGESC